MCATQIFCITVAWIITFTIHGSLSLSEKGQCPAAYRVFQDHTACMIDKEGVTHYEMTSKERGFILDYHNRLRGQVNPKPTNMLKLSWDTNLEILARRWAAQCVKKHDRVKFIPGHYAVNQNLFFGGRQGYQWKTAIDVWYGEVKDYTYGKKIDYLPQDPVIGHYTQLTWAQTYKLGCAAVWCSRQKLEIFACNYAPYGNVMPFNAPYKTGDTICSECKDHCDNGVCVCPAVECNYGKLNPTTCKCECKPEATKITNLTNCTPLCKTEKDLWFCGNYNGWMKQNCNSGVRHPYCPNLCDVCKAMKLSPGAQGLVLRKLEHAQMSKVAFFTTDFCLLCVPIIYAVLLSCTIY